MYHTAIYGSQKEEVFTTSANDHNPSLLRAVPIKEGIEFDGQQDLRTKVMIAAGSYIVFQRAP